MLTKKHSCVGQGDGLGVQTLKAAESLSASYSMKASGRADKLLWIRFKSLNFDVIALSSNFCCLSQSTSAESVSECARRLFDVPSCLPTNCEIILTLSWSY